jgi:hypothetical protein
MVGRRRYGRVGTVAMPYFALFEAFGPLLEAGGYGVLALSLALGWVSWPLAFAFAGLSVGFGLVLSFATLLMEERAFRRYPSWRDLGRLTTAALVENCGYRQLMSVVRARALWTLWRGRGSHTWGEMTRTGLEADPQRPPGAATAHP